MSTHFENGVQDECNKGAGEFGPFSPIWILEEFSIACIKVPRVIWKDLLLAMFHCTKIHLVLSAKTHLSPHNFFIMSSTFLQ